METSEILTPATPANDVPSIDSPSETSATAVSTPATEQPSNQAIFTPPPLPESANGNLSAPAILSQPDSTQKAPLINLLAHDEEPVQPMQTVTSTSAAASSAKIAVHPLRRLWVALAAGVVVLSVSAAAAYIVIVKKPGHQPATKTLTQSPKATTPPVQPEAEPPAPAQAPVAAPTPTPETVTAPAVTPTASHPQTVTITSKNGLWLRSTPDSSNRRNIISWIPNGGQISVDQTADFWWHGTYRGTTGYFASKYTQ